MLLLCLVTMLILVVIAYGRIDELKKTIDKLGIDVVSNNRQINAQVVLIKADVQNSVTDLDQKVDSYWQMCTDKDQSMSTRITTLNTTLDTYWHTFTLNDRQVAADIVKLRTQAFLARHKQLFNRDHPVKVENVFSDVNGNKQMAFNGYYGERKAESEGWLAEYMSGIPKALVAEIPDFKGGYIYVDISAEGYTDESVTGCRVYSTENNFTGYMFIGANNKEGPWTILFKTNTYEEKQIDGAYFLDMPASGNKKYFQYIGVFRDKDAGSLKIQELQLFVDDFFPEKK